MTPATPKLDPRAARILVCDDLDPVALSILRERGFEPEVRTGLSEDELVLTVPGVHALIVRSATRATRRVIEAATQLRVIGRAGIGVDNVDCDAATERGIVVMNTPTGNTTTTAELAIALLCSLARHVSRAERSVRSGSWKKKALVGSELTGKTLGVVGMGRIGRIVAERALGLKLHVIASDPYLTSLDADSPLAAVELVELDTLLRSSDFVTLHVPKIESTQNLISREKIALMKPGARLINAARGGVVDEQALLDALDDGRLAGAALDVLAEEPPSKDNPLLNRDDVIVTPHLGAASAEAQYNVAFDIANQIGDFLSEGVAHNAINAPAVSAQTLGEIAPYVLLAEKIGSFLAQRLGNPIKKVELTLVGEIAGRDHRHIPLALLSGILRHGQDAGVNFVNAPLIARERGIRLLSTEEESSSSFPSLIRVRASTQGGEASHLVCGTVFGRTPKFVRVDDMHVDIEPRGLILITRHADRPGVLGMLGTVLGRHGANIRRVELGPPPADAADGLASAFLSLDEEPPDAVVEELTALDPVREIRLVRL